MASDRKLRLWCLACRFASGRGHGDNLYRIIDRTDGADGGNAANNARSWANPDFDEPEDPSPAMKCDILRDIIGNPFRPVTIQPEWLTPQALTLATAAYEERTGQACKGCWTGQVLAPLGSGRVLTDCILCHGTGRITTGHLDPVRLAVLADALEEAGCNVGLLHEHKDNATHYWYNDAFGKQWPHLTPDRAAEHPILAHLRSPGPHYRGCWAIDLLTNKE